mgnify:CR=1 FL=1
MPVLRKAGLIGVSVHLSPREACLITSDDLRDFPQDLTLQRTSLRVRRVTCKIVLFTPPIATESFAFHAAIPCRRLQEGGVGTTPLCYAASRVAFAVVMPTVEPGADGVLGDAVLLGNLRHRLSLPDPFHDLTFYVRRDARSWLWHGGMVSWLFLPYRLWTMCPRFGVRATQDLPGPRLNPDRTTRILCETTRPQCFPSRHLGTNSPQLFHEEIRLCRGSCVATHAGTPDRRSQQLRKLCPALNSA